MMRKEIKKKGILAKLLEKAIWVLLKKECKKISKIEIDIIAESREIIKGIINKINIIAEEINYKDILFDKIQLEANDIKVVFKMKDNELKFKQNFIIKFKISLSEDSLKNILLSNTWYWIGDMISKEILDQGKLEDIKIVNSQLLIKSSTNSKSINELEKVFIKAEDGNLYLENKDFSKSIEIPIEDKVCIKNVKIKDNLINIFAKSSISF